ncbi:putative Diguanylate cyclase [[Clostridium] ultunense Esp]|nr:putative Diguanylate cyclase [[Clostridium] ultunense Esp]
MDLQTFRETIQNVQHLIFRADRQGDSYYLTFFEGLLAKDLGLSTEKVAGISYHTLFPQYEEQFNEVRARVEKGLATQIELDHDGRTYRVFFNPLIEGDQVKAIVGIAEEVTHLRHLEQEVKEKEYLFAKLYQEGILIQQNGQIVNANQQAEHLFGYSLEELKKINPLRLMSKESRPLFFEKIKNGEEETFEVSILRKDGTSLPVEVSMKNGTYRNSKAVISIFRDLTERKQKEEMIRQLAYYDPLTQFPNRFLFLERLNHEISFTKEKKGHIALILFDIDRFKYINDTLGHTFGDQVLQEAGKRINEAVNGDHLVARLGGDEFALFLTGIEESVKLTQLIERIREHFSQPFLLRGQEYYFTVSIGVSLYPEDGTDAETLLKNADTALFRAKEQGRNTYQFYTSSMYTEAFQRLVLENHLRRALENGEFTLFYQPLVDVSTGRITGVEALIRWQHPELGIISPGEFIPVAEENGLIIPIGDWVLTTACKKANEWIHAGFPPLRLNVNLSARQFQQPDFIDRIWGILKETGLPPQYLVIELTESIIMQNAEVNASRLQKLKEMGVMIAIDDFGTGYSSLSYLRRLPIDTLKIDRSFVWEISNSSDDRVIASAVISLAKSLQLKVVAEGVETTEQAEFLQKNGCYEMQGYLFSRPLPDQKMEEMFKAKREYF